MVSSVVSGREKERNALLRRDFTMERFSQYVRSWYKKLFISDISLARMCKGLGVMTGLIFLALSPLKAQDFEGILKEFTGSESDQIESEVAEKKPETKPLGPSSNDIMSTLEVDDFAPPENVKTNGVVLQGLDKTTARVFILEAPLDKQIEFGTLRVTVHRCEKAPAESHQESIAFVTIMEAKPNCPVQKLFSGWMFASSPALSALDHPLYDVWIKECKNIKKK